MKIFKLSCDEETTKAKKTFQAQLDAEDAALMESANAEVASFLPEQFRTPSKKTAKGATVPKKMPKFNMTSIGHTITFFPLSWQLKRRSWTPNGRTWTRLRTSTRSSYSLTLASSGPSCPRAR